MVYKGCEDGAASGTKGGLAVTVTEHSGVEGGIKEETCAGSRRFAFTKCRSALTWFRAQLKDANFEALGFTSTSVMEGEPAILARVRPWTPEPEQRSRIAWGWGEERRGRDFKRQQVSGPRYITSSEAGRE